MCMKLQLLVIGWFVYATRITVSLTRLCLLGSLGNYVWYDDGANGIQVLACCNGINGLMVYYMALPMA